VFACLPANLLQARIKVTEAIAASYAAALGATVSQVVVKQVTCDDKAFLDADTTTTMWISTLREQEKLAWQPCNPSEEGSTCKVGFGVQGMGLGW
jgi:hypothetical protein